MNPRLGRLIAELTGSSEWSSSDAWSRALLVQSEGEIPPSRATPGDHPWNRGFNMILLGPGGVPRHFCRCRHAADEAARRAFAIQATLCGVPELKHIIPPTHDASDDRIQVQLSAFQSGERYDSLAARLGQSAWEESLEHILEAADLLSTRAAAALPGLLQTGPVSLVTASAMHLATLQSAGVAGADLEILTAALAAAGAVPRRLQHGDLWTRNIIWARGSCWLLDLDLFGLVQVPLYDVFELVRSSSELRGLLRPSTGSAWLPRMARADATARAGRRVIARARKRLGLTAHQTTGVLTYFVVDTAARLYGRGAPPALEAPYFADVETLARTLRRGESPARLYLAA